MQDILALVMSNPLYIAAAGVVGLVIFIFLMKKVFKLAMLLLLGVLVYGGYIYMTEDNPMKVIQQKLEVGKSAFKDIDGATEGITWGGNMSNVGLYFKPKYTSSSVTLYALLGMGHVKLDLDNIGEVSETEFQWGAGISIDGGKSIVGNSKISFFLDYVRLYDEEAPIIATDILVVDTFTVGLIFKF